MVKAFGLLVCGALVAFGGAFIAKFLLDGYHAISWVRVVLYFALPAGIVAAGVIGICWLRARTVIAVNIGAVVAALYLFEFVLAFLPPSAAEAVVQQGEYSGWTACGVYSWHDGTEATTARIRTFTIGEKSDYFAIGGLSNFSHPTYGRPTDGYGFNNPKDQWRLGATEIVAVGDSFTWGYDVPAGAGYVDLIRQSMGATTVNLACGGNGPLEELAALIEYGQPLKPRVVLWFYYEGNDLGNLYYRRSTRQLLEYLEDNHRLDLIEHQRQIDAFLRSVRVDLTQEREANREARLLPLLGLRLRLYGLRTTLGVTQVFHPEIEPLFRAVLRRAKDATAAWGGRLIFEYLPAEERFATALGRVDAGVFGKRIREIVGGEGIEVIDIAEAFEAHAQPRRLYRGHFAPEANRIVADIVAKRLLELR